MPTSTPKKPASLLDQARKCVKGLGAISDRNIVWAKTGSRQQKLSEGNAAASAHPDNG
jgi:hypothetical protein